MSQEHSLIDNLTLGFPVYHSNVVKGIGDDCAVWQEGGRNVLFTTDSMVEGDHFLKDWFYAEQVGIRLVESNVSDIAAMGGIPSFLFVSLILTGNEHPDWLSNLYRGIELSCKKYQMTLMGGNITHGNTLSLTAGVYGYCEGNIIYRRGARLNDLVVVTGDIASACVARILMGKGYIINPLLMERLATPSARIAEAQLIARYATAMIDISDGLASEARHICQQSNKGVVLKSELFPFHPKSYDCASKLEDITLVDCALRGGEDYELMFTISESDFEKLKKEYPLATPLTAIGKIRPEMDGLKYSIGEQLFDLPEGFDHFSKNINL